MRMTAKGRRNDGGGSSGINYTSCSTRYRVLVRVLRHKLHSAITGCMVFICASSILVRF